MRIVIDTPDLVKNRQWMKRFKKRWKSRLEQLELWVISYKIEIERECLNAGLRCSRCGASRTRAVPGMSDTWTH